MKIKLILLGLFTMVFFSACAPQNIPLAKLKTISNVGVISIHGNEMPSLERGLTIFGNEDSTTDISSWSIDTYIENEMKSLLSKKYKIKVIHLSSNEIAKMNDEYEVRRSLIEDLLMRNRLDTLVVFEKGMIIREHYDTHSGIGVIKAKALGLEATHITLNMDLISYSMKEDEVEILHFNDIKSLAELENSLWTDTTQPIPSTSMKTIEVKLKALLHESLLREFQKIGYLNEI